MAADAGTDVRIADHRATDESAFPSRARGTQREIGLLAVGEVPLVEQAHRFEAVAAGEHQRAVRMTRRLPPLVEQTRARGSRRSTGRRSGSSRHRRLRTPVRRRDVRQRVEHAAKATGLRQRVVWRERDPVPLAPRCRGSGGSRRWRRDRTRGCVPASSTTTSRTVDVRQRRRAVVDDRDRHRDVLGAERRDRVDQPLAVGCGARSRRGAPAESGQTALVEASSSAYCTSSISISFVESRSRASHSSTGTSPGWPAPRGPGRWCGSVSRRSS